ncbi:unnamed protein product [Protopolystoma xenopodis]|uniref:Uncharacterized protein n=1 Tax=Protopolystoma xenopodis TaxID=117903 RepID=A0A448WUC4_9PLAT|nr:unnamed protein product [Protopolystoma xenopodis]
MCQIPIALLEFIAILPMKDLVYQGISLLPGILKGCFHLENGVQFRLRLIFSSTAPTSLDRCCMNWFRGGSIAVWA